MRGWRWWTLVAGVSLCFACHPSIDSPPADWTPLHQAIENRVPPPAPVRYPAGRITDACKHLQQATDLENAFTQLDTGDEAMADSFFEKAAGEPGANAFAPAFFAWGMSAWERERLDIARQCLRRAIGAVSRGIATKVSYDEPASRDYPIRCSTARSYHLYINLCSLYVEDNGYEDVKRLQLDIAKQPYSDAILRPLLERFREDPERYPSHLVWALSNFERLYRYPPHNHHPVIRFNTGVTLMRLREYELAARFFDIDSAIEHKGGELGPLDDDEYRERMRQETRQLLPMDELTTMEGVCRLHRLEVREAKRLFIRAGRGGEFAGLVELLEPFETVVHGEAEQAAAALRTADGTRPRYDDQGLPFEPLLAAALNEACSPLLAKANAKMDEGDFKAALETLDDINLRYPNPNLRAQVRPYWWYCWFRHAASHPSMFLAPAALLLPLILSLIVLCSILKNWRHYNRTIACRWRPIPVGMNKECD